MKKQLIYATLAMITFAACTNDEEHVANLESPVEATFIGQVNLANTRGDGDGNNSTETTATPTTEAWTDTYATIGISALKYTSSSQKEADYANVKYTTTLTSEGSTYSATFETENKFYFQTPSEKASFVAYAPYVDASSSPSDYSDGVIDVHAKDASSTSSSDFAVTDYIWAQTDDLDYSHSQASLQFAHKMVKLNITAVLSSEVSLSGKVTISGATLSNLITDGSFTLSTGAVATDEAPTKREVSLTVSSTDATQAALEDFIALPQSGLVLTITTSDGNTYQSTLTQSLTSGNAYTFTVTAKKSALDVKAEITPWITEGNEKEKEAGMTVLPIGDVTDADGVWLYDLVFSDGTFMHTTDRSEGSFLSSLNIKESQASEVRGFVFFKEDMTQLDGELKNDYPNCTHGLIAALDDASTSTNWMDGTFPNQSIATTDYGYTNTKKVQAYNESVGNDGLKIKPMICIEEYAEKYPSPTNCSPWFWGYNEVFYLLNTYDTANTLLNKLSSLSINTASQLSNNYWTNLFNGNKANYVRKVSWVNNIQTTTSNTETHPVRAVCAF